MPGIANRTVPRLRAQPGSLLSLLPVRNVKDQPVGGSRREQTHTRVHTHLFKGTDKSAHVDKSLWIHTHWHTQTHKDKKSMHTETHKTDKRTHTPAHTHSGLAHCGITSRGLQPGQAMRPQLRWFRLPAASPLRRPGGAAQNDSTTPTPRYCH